MKVDKDKCIGCGHCVKSLPHSYHIDNDGKSEAIGDEFYPDCPVGAISES
jgi:ferredoxin